MLKWILEPVEFVNITNDICKLCFICSIDLEIVCVRILLGPVGMEQKLWKFAHITRTRGKSLSSFILVHMVWKTVIISLTDLHSSVTRLAELAMWANMIVRKIYRVCRSHWMWTQERYILWQKFQRCSVKSRSDLRFNMKVGLLFMSIGSSYTYLISLDLTRAGSIPKFIS